MTVKTFAGPWIYDPKKTYPSGYGNESEAIVDSNGNIVLMFDPSMGEYELALAYDSPNLSLILAAPDLLEALQGILGYFDSGNNVSVSQATIKAGSDEIKAARAAIAKATYKEP